MKRLALLLFVACSTPSKQAPDANPEQEKENAQFEGYLAGYSEAEAKAPAAPPKPAEPVKWEDPDLQVVCWRAPEGISCLPAHTVKAKPRWK